jgi:hypothetical protein
MAAQARGTGGEDEEARFSPNLMTVGVASRSGLGLSGGHWLDSALA